MNIRILYEDNHLLVAVKPPNMPVQADASGDEDMLTYLKKYIKERYNKPGNVYLGLVHRLDRPVGGVIVFARTSKAASRLSDQFRSRTAAKKYLAVVTGNPPAYAMLEDYLVKDEAARRARITGADAQGAKRAALSFRRLVQKQDASLLEVELMTGRYHQIRAQLAHFGTPIYGDKRYNPGARSGEQIALWAYQLSFIHPTLKESVVFTDMPPDNTAPWNDYQFTLKGLSEGLDVAYIDDNILIADKASGQTVAKQDGGEDTLQERLGRAFGSVYPVHRLDGGTTGLVLFARNDIAFSALSNAMRDRMIDKYYECLVKGSPTFEQAELRTYGVKDAEAGMMRVYPEPRLGAREMITFFRVLKREGEVSRLEARLITGRTHQIRAQLSYEGYPIVGDDKYGDREFNRRMGARTIALCAVRLTLHFPAGSPLAYLDNRTFTADPPF